MSDSRDAARSGPQRIVVFRIGELGDTLVALPAFWAIRRQFPHAHLCLLSNDLEAEQGVHSHSILPTSGLFDQFLYYPSSITGTRWSSSIRLLRELRAARFDLLIYLSPRRREPWQVHRDLLFFRAAGIARAVGHDGTEPDGATPEYCHRSGQLHMEHETDHLLSRLRRSGIHVPDDGGLRGMDLGLEQAERARVQAWFAAQLIPAGRPLVAFGPGTRRPSKRWPEERYREVGDRLCRERNVHPVVFGGPEEAAVGRRLVRAWGRGCNAAGVLSVREAAAALEQCALYVGNDTGTMHLAAAAGVPCVVVFSAQDWPGKWDPYGQGHVVLRRNVSCQGCHLNVCTNEGLRCLLDITVEEVVRACAGKLQEAGTLTLRTKAEAAQTGERR